MTPLRAASAVAWLPWSRAAFARAREEDKAVLLSLSAVWSGACDEMDRQCYADPAIADEINRWFVPIRVDADRRPDVAERYELGGLPTTAFLTADGEILGGGTFVPPGKLVEALRQARRPRPFPQRPSVAPVPRTQHSSTSELIALVFDSFDHEHGGFGGAPKFPLVAPVRLALELYGESNDERMAEYASRTLDGMGWNGLYDEELGGFFRCAARADWQEPQAEKLLSTNAALLKLYLDAGIVLGNERYLARAADVLEFVQRELGGGGPDGWKLCGRDDEVRYTDANAAMAAAALQASQVFNDDRLREFALRSLEAVLLAAYRPGLGAAHCPGGVRGLLGDQVAMAAAHLDAWDLTRDPVYRMMAEELVRFMLRTMWDSEGGFLDRWSSEADEEPAGFLAHQVKPFVLNCEAAQVLHRLSRASENDELDRGAAATLEGARREAAGQGPLAAHLLLAQRSLSR